MVLVESFVCFSFIYSNCLINKISTSFTDVNINPTAAFSGYVFNKNIINCCVATLRFNLIDKEKRKNLIDFTI